MINCVTNLESRVIYVMHLLELRPVLYFFRCLLRVHLLNNEGIEMTVWDFFCIVQHPCVFNVRGFAHMACKFLENEAHEEIILNLQ